MPLRVVHLATDSIAGMPFRLVKTLQRQENLIVNLIEVKRRNSYPQDVIFGDDVEKAVELITKADIIHLHNNLDTNSEAFYPVNFKKLEQKGTRFVRQFHSVPSTIARKMKCSVESVLSCPIPSIVIGQFQERFYPKALVVPNFVPLNDPLYLPEKNGFSTDILYTPSKVVGAWSDRWNTKGLPETKRILKRLENETGCRTKILNSIPLESILREKQQAYIIVDEMVTGSYHLSGLEGLCMGRPTFAYLDKRTEFIMRFLSGSTSIPFINVRLEESHRVLKHILLDRGTGEEIGQLSRKWMEGNWNDDILVKQYLEMYEKLMVNPDLVKRQKELIIMDGAVQFFSIVLPNLEYEQRKVRNNKINLNPYFLILMLLKRLRRMRKRSMK